ncbi:trimeric intracellular cation channel family protein [Phreatobacter sp.]|uniref:trimeric intracellular cation channel family protein n=1 Tax=Phreatobacter sp. TaxID=1966341 RepID=UPI0022C20E43|nr:trimeric intracellular cation channel family protein [Phreatobacter sp.]MCZ8316038.1 trimeric intracellular cation channel family protein [Phreatobacter sp.]
MTALLPWLEWAGIAVFALTGALVAARKQMDPFGFALLGTVTGIGGGTLRDVLLGIRPVTWIIDPTAVVICAAVALAAFFTAHLFERENRARAILWADAVGLALFTATGAARALDAGAPAISAVLLGVVTATFGGIIRDILAGDVPLALRRDVYVTASLAGAVAFVAVNLWISPDLDDLAGFTTTFAIRALAIRGNWSLPTYGRRDG